MIQLAVRDDDLNAYTKLEDLIELYSPIKGFPISFAVVPFVTDVLGGCPETKGNKTPSSLEANEEVVTWLKSKLKNKECDVLLHGITHEYHFDERGRKIPEMVWRENDENITKTIFDSKNYLQELLDYEISCFVAPNNIISKKCLYAVVYNNLHFSGIIPANFQRKLSIKSVCNFFKRFLVRGVHKIQYPGILDYGDHLELNACGLRSLDYMKKIYNYCETNNLPMVINVHYWNLRDNNDNRKMLFDFIEYALADNAKPSTVSQILRDYKA